MLIRSEMGNTRIGDFMRRAKTTATGRRILVKDPPHFHEWVIPHCRPFTSVVDMDMVAKYVRVDNFTWEGLSQHLTEGPMCMRGSFMPGSAKPSEAAIEHEKIRLSMMYEFHSRYARQVASAPLKGASARLLEKFHRAQREGGGD